MSTYYPKTLKRWKLHKRSLEDLQPSPRTRHSQAKSQVIHSLEADPHAPAPPYGLHKERYRLEDSRNKSMLLSNGFRKLKKEGNRLAFSKVVSEEHFIRVDFANECANQQTMPSHYLPKMVPKNKKIMLIRSQVRRKPAFNCILKDLLQVKPSVQVPADEILQTDGEQGNLHLLEEEGFSPYRAPKHPKSDEHSPPVARPIHYRPPPLPERPRQAKREDLTSESITNFMSINEIGLKAKQGTRLGRKNGRSLSVMEIKL